MDELSRQLLELLRGDSPMGLVKLAALVPATRAHVKLTLERMRTAGIVRHTHAGWWVEELTAREFEAPARPATPPKAPPPLGPAPTKLWVLRREGEKVILRDEPGTLYEVSHDALWRGAP